MSTPSGDKAALAAPIAQAKALVEAGREALDIQDELFDTISAEDMVEARELLGHKASRIDVLRCARERRRGRPKNARNKRTDDFAKYVLSHGIDPAIVLIQIASTQPEMLIEASRQEKVHSFRADGTPNVVIERMTFDQAQALRARCADILMPYLHAKKPVALDVSWTGVADMMIEGLTHSREEMDEARRQKEAVEGEFYEIEGQTAPEREG